MESNLLSLNGFTSEENINEDLNLIQDDKFYFSEVGQRYLSKSSAGALIRTPALFGQSKEDCIAFTLGSYFHYLLIEPEKATLEHVYEGASRNNKGYKEYIAENGLAFCALRKEAEMIEAIAKKVEDNVEICKMVFEMGARYEVPAIKEVFGLLWKGKADIVGEHFVYDLKTTGDISRFMYTAKTYDYDLQAYLYREFFGKDMVFIVACKKTHQLGVFDCSQSFYDSGEWKARKAVENYKKFWGEDPEFDVDQFFLTGSL
jgi:uncharacterized pyridoxamine 5'-phosphate oxidase family protein